MAGSGVYLAWYNARMRIVFEQHLTPALVETEDSGMAKITEFSSDGSELFVRVQSYNEGLDEFGDPVEGPVEHPEFDALVGKRVRVTIETID